MPDFPHFSVVPVIEKQRLGLTREIAVLDKVPERHGYRLAINTLIHTGMRIEELPAIKVHNLDDGTIWVDKAISEGELRLSRKSGGVVPYDVSPQLWEQLMEHIKGKNPDDYVFTYDGTNEPLSTGRLYKVWSKAVKDAAVKHISLQNASRHSKASEIWERKRKEAKVEIAQQLGHDNLTTGKKHYVVEEQGAVNVPWEKKPLNKYRKNK